MLNFVVCEDDKNVRKKIVNLITKIMMPHDYEYLIHEYEDCCSKIKKLVIQNTNKNIYILDIELPTKSGLDIARKLEKKIGKVLLSLSLLIMNWAWKRLKID